MADNGEDEAEEPAVELGDGEPIEGAPIARIAARLTWGLERSEVSRKEGESTVRTPDGPRSLDSILDEVDVPYFESRQAFTGAIRDVIGTGPVQTAEE